MSLHPAIRRCLAAVVLTIAWLAPAAAIEPLEFADRAEEQRYQQLLRELRCLQCQNQSLADSGSNVAGGLRLEIHKQMQAGRSDDEIKAFLVDRYGEFVLYRPEVKSGTWLLWFGPFAILAGAGLALILTLRKRRAKAAAVAETTRDEEDW